MGFPEARMALPHDVLARLASLTGYDQMLEMDSISRSHNVGLAEIESQLAAFKSGTINTQPDEIADFSPVSSKEVVNLENAQPIDTAPKYIDNPDNYRLRYDPSRQGQSNQSQVNQAIVCPTCSAPLGIPNIRPIKVTCPQCMTESVFHS
tara:strand:- start:37 stop:486 length:450 start_codon:yes stop_codon:yes gene_type:complete